MEEIKSNEWQEGEIIEIKERYTKHPYLDIYIKSEGLRAPKVRLSIPNSTEEGAELTSLLRRFEAKISRDLIGKKVYYRYHLKPNPQDNSHFFKIVNPKDIKTTEEYEFEKAMWDCLGGKDEFSTDASNRLIKELNKNDNTNK